MIGAAMMNPMGESNGETLRLDFDQRLIVQFRAIVSLMPRLRTNFYHPPDLLQFGTKMGRR